MKTIAFRLLFFIAGFFAAFNSHAESIGQYASDLVEPVNILSNFVSSASLIIGVMLLVASLMRYLQYRINPLASPLSTVIMFLILGLLLVALPFMYLLLGAGIPFTLFGHSYA